MPGSPSSSLLDIAHLIDHAFLAHPSDVAFYVIHDADEVVLGVRELRGHPCIELADLTADSDWWAFGVRVNGTAHFLDGSRGPESVATTYLLDRDGASVSLLRRGDAVREELHVHSGRVPDLCRRILTTTASEIVTSS